MMTGFERYTKKTRRAMFLEEMEQVVPWAKLWALIEPHYPKPGNGRRPKELEQMLRIYFLQQWFNLADPAVEEALYDSATLRQFVGIDLGAEPVPDETTVCKFRHLLEEHNLGEEILGTVNLYLQAKGVRITTGTIVDATLIHAPSSTKNREQSRDPEMHQTRKGKNWYFGMKAHVGVDSKTKIIHTAVATAANVSDVAMLPDLLHGEETRVWGDGAYQGQTRVMRECAPGARDFTQRTHHQARQFHAALSASGSGAGDGAQRARVAQQVSPPDDATRTKDRQGRHGPQTSGSYVLDVAKGMGLRAGEKVRFARGTARTSRWCAVEHRVIDWASRSSLRKRSPK